MIQATQNLLSTDIPPPPGAGEKENVLPVFSLSLHHSPRTSRLQVIIKNYSTRRWVQESLGERKQMERKWGELPSHSIPWANYLLINGSTRLNVHPTVGNSRPVPEDKVQTKCFKLKKEALKYKHRADSYQFDFLPS